MKAALCVLALLALSATNCEAKKKGGWYRPVKKVVVYEEPVEPDTVIVTAASPDIAPAPAPAEGDLDVTTAPTDDDDGSATATTDDDDGIATAATDDDGTATTDDFEPKVTGQETARTVDDDGSAMATAATDDDDGSATATAATDDDGSGTATAATDDGSAPTDDDDGSAESSEEEAAPTDDDDSRRSLNDGVATVVVSDDDGPCMSVAETAADNPALTTLVAALSAADLANTLDLSFMGTVFAPTDAAFASLLETLGLTAEQLLADTDLLTQVLLLHVIPDNVLFSTELTDGLELATAAEGVSVNVAIDNGDTYIVAPSGVRARVIFPNVNACDAIVHVIDVVLTAAP